MPNLTAHHVSHSLSLERADALELSAEVLRDQAQEIYVRVVAQVLLDEYPTATHLILYPSDEREGYYGGALLAGDEILVEDGEGVGDLAVDDGPDVAYLIRRLHSCDNWERFTEIRQDELGAQWSALNLRAALHGQAV